MGFLLHRFTIPIAAESVAKGTLDVETTKATRPMANGRQQLDSSR
jgi:hypothetical protein